MKNKGRVPHFLKPSVPPFALPGSQLVALLLSLLLPLESTLLKPRITLEGLKISVFVLSFHFIGLEEIVSRAKRKPVSSCLGITYLALGISNPVGAKLSRWCLGINSFDANWDIRRSCMLRRNCPAGGKFSGRRFVSMEY